MMNLFPFYEDIEGKLFLIIGGGPVARHKLCVLRQFTDRITVLAEQTDISEVPVIRKRFSPEDLEPADYVIAATGFPETDREISELCRAAGKKVNVPDQAELCSFFFPAILKRGPLVLSVSTCGTSPAYARELKEKAAEAVPSDIEEILDRMSEVRTWVPSLLVSQKARAALYRWLLGELTDGRCVTDGEIRKKADELK
ncbi:MAG: bifunctional precorrin-2 dehydrogenase/sirohydrochlorin ferrochelatase [Stomatobaculum sp.]|nr:bifunctional precorrin-2 dehydrogenase/sirohydrochlorin ferrochelatase [Stomatobaculum sp.]